MINVTKPYLPDREKLNRHIDRIYEKAWLTNNGPLTQELTVRLEKYLGVENLLLVSNGTLALQIAYKALGLSGEVITTPFSFVATTSSLLWEGLEPVFADIDKETCCIDATKISEAISSKTTAILPVHVFGNSCDVEKIDSIAHEHDLKVIYDGAHAFGVKYKGKSVLSYGDATILSFHATKLFHTIEGGAIIFKKREDYERAKLMTKFGIDESENITEIGINTKMNEFQAAMGLAVLDDIEYIVAERAKIWSEYEKVLKKHLHLIKFNSHASNNYSYFPVIFDNEEELLRVRSVMNARGINPRRYFFPSLDTLPFVSKNSHRSISEDISCRILCLPIYPGMEESEVKYVIEVIRSCLPRKG